MPQKDVLFNRLYEAFTQFADPTGVIHECMAELGFNKVEELDDEFKEWCAEKGFSNPVRPMADIQRKAAKERDYVRVGKGAYDYVG